MISPVLQYLAGAAKLAARGMGVAALMGVFFGLAIGIGGLMMGIDPDRLVALGGMSGWVSGLVSMLYVFTRIRRKGLI